MEAKKKKKMGFYMKRLVCEYASVLAVPPGGDFKDALRSITEPGRLQADLKAACKWVEEKLTAVKAAPDNRFGDDDEAIAKHILEKLQVRRGEQKTKLQKGVDQC